jgi:serine/threonine protein kinase
MLHCNAPLPDGLKIAGYRIVKKIASGGFSIVYLAYDEDGNAVAIKEYLPSSLALRQWGELAPAISPQNLPTFRIGLKCFFEEGRALARIAHPNVVSVINFFRANETVYMVMAYESGRSLQEHILRRRDKGENPLVSEKFIRKMFRHVMNGLREVHTHKLLHLDLKPANIYLRADVRQSCWTLALHGRLCVPIRRNCIQCTRQVSPRPNCMSATVISVRGPISTASALRFLPAWSGFRRSRSISARLTTGWKAISASWKACTRRS